MSDFRDSRFTDRGGAQGVSGVADSASSDREKLGSQFWGIPSFEKAGDRGSPKDKLSFREWVISLIQGFQPERLQVARSSIAGVSKRQTLFWTPLLITRSPRNE